jgi:DNA-binding CsgD family transcriptional regulator
VVHALIGRELACQTLDQTLDSARDGEARVLVLRGGPGIGKTALLQHLIASARGFTVAHAAGVESEMELPFAGAHQLCAPMLDRLAELPEPQCIAASTAFGLSVGTSPDRLLIGLAILNLLAGASDASPLLCVIDDAHWLDRESAQALAFVARRLLAERVALVFASRWRVEDLADFPELLVEGLVDGDAQTLLGSVLHAPLDERVRNRIVAESGGNPLALVEWPQRLSPAELAGGFAVPNRMAEPGEIEATFRQRVAELPSLTRRFLAVAAAEPTGDPIIVWRAASALGIAPGDPTPAIDAGLIAVGVRITFRHPLVRSASYRAAPVDERLAAHRALADATDPDLDPDRRAWHRALGSPGPDEDIAAALERSASRARARGGLAATAALLERSVVLTEDPLRRAERVLAAADAHLEAGAFDSAAAMLALAEATPLDDLGRANLDLLRARQISWGVDNRDAPRLFLRAAKGFEPLNPDLAGATYVQALAAACVAGTFASDVSIGDIALATISRATADEPTPRDWLVTGLARATADGPAAAAPLLRLALDAAHSETIDGDAIRWLGSQCGAASVLWDIESFRRLAALRLAATRELGALHMLPWALSTVVHASTLEGDLEGAASLLAEANQIVEATGSKLLPWTGAIIAGWTGDGDAGSMIDDLIASAHAAGDGLALKNAQWASAMAHNGTGQYDRALAVGLEANRHPWEWGAHICFHEVVEAAVRCGERDVAAAMLGRIVESTAASGTDWALGIQRRCEALLADDADADALYRQAIAHLSRTRLRPELARSHLLYGEWLRRSNRRVDARAELQTAYDLLVSMGIHAFAERCRHELLLTGATVRKRTVGSYDELTPQELEVSRLARDGLTNAEIGARLFISVRTVEWHLRKVFTKLGISSRRELKRVLPAGAQLAPN